MKEIASMTASKAPLKKYLSAVDELTLIVLEGTSKTAKNKENLSVFHEFRRSSDEEKCRAWSLGVIMRILLSIAAILGLLATLWCAAGYFFAPAQAGETRAELRVFLDRPVSADVPEIHASRDMRDGRNDGIAALLIGAATVLMFTSLVLSCRRKS